MNKFPTAAPFRSAIRDLFRQPRATAMTRFSKLLPFVESQNENGLSNSHLLQEADMLANAPIFTGATYNFVHSKMRPDPSASSTRNDHSVEKSEAGSVIDDDGLSLIPQYGLVGTRQDEDHIGEPAEDRLVLANMNTPWSAFICGSQGSGKSHTISCLLENALVPDNPSGELPHPLAGLVMHYDKFTNYNSTQICEAAYICSSGIPVTVLVSPSNIWAMKRLYSTLPGLSAGAPKPKILPLYLKETQLNISRILKLMAIDPAANETPLYMDVVMNIARDMAMEGPGFTYTEFRRRISLVKWLPGQATPLNMRLQLLDSIIEPSMATLKNKPASSKENIWSFEPGSLTIIDLSDPFFSSADACTLFSICLSIFLEDRNQCGRVVVLDEAHKVGKTDNYVKRKSLT